jgi:hypothetical protein
MITSSNGIKIGLIGLGEREWLATINSLPPNLIYKSASQTAKEYDILSLSFPHLAAVYKTIPLPHAL